MTADDLARRPVPPAMAEAWAVRATAVHRLLSGRPEVTQEALIVVASLYFVIVCNLPFWRALLAERIVQGHGIGYAAAVGIAFVALHFMLIGVLATRWTVKPLIALI